MMKKRKVRLILFLCFLAVLLVSVALAIFLQPQNCLGVPLLQERELSAYNEVTDFDLSTLTFNGEAAAIDYESGILYLSQSSQKLSEFTALEGILKTAQADYDLYFLEEAVLEDIPAAVRSGTPLTLILTDGTSFQKVPVIISTLPVVKLDGEVTHTDDEDRDVFAGNVTLWTGFDPLLQGYSTKSSAVQWHKRGNYTQSKPKNPWKLSLKKDNGKNNHVDFLGLGADDDWILNSMVMDDTKIREKLFMDLWNTNAANSENVIKMSDGEYVEAVINGKYCGVYLLQRRLDAKYLELGDEDVLLKGTDYGAPNVRAAYEFVTPEVNTKEIYGLMQGVFDRRDCSIFNLRNVIDTNLFLQFVTAGDNFDLKNIYFVLKKTGKTHTLYYLPWDTDMSFGLVWKTDIGFSLDHDITLYDMRSRVETEGVKKIWPAYNRMVRERWQELRETLFSQEEVFRRADALYSQLCESGAWDREKSTWEDRYGGEDTLSNLKQFVIQRTEILNEYYAEK